MIEHAPWIGNDYKDGIAGQKVAIVGYSHHHISNDYDAMTEDVVRKVRERLEGYEKIRFFADIASYFGFRGKSDFWDKVVFFNFVPDMIGNSSKRFDKASEDQHRRGAQRSLRIMADLKPDKVFIFSKKACDQFPPSEDNVDGRPNPKLGVQFERFGIGRYGNSTAIFLRHPQGANGSVLREAVAQGMKIGHQK